MTLEVLNGRIESSKMERFYWNYELITEPSTVFDNEDGRTYLGKLVPGCAEGDENAKMTSSSD